MGEVVEGGKMTTSFYSEEEIKKMGFAHIGHEVQISRKASIYGAKNTEAEFPSWTAERL